MGQFPLCEKSPEALLIIGFTTATGVLVMMVMIELLGLTGYHGCWRMAVDWVSGEPPRMGSGECQPRVLFFFYTTSLPMAS